MASDNSCNASFVSLSIIYPPNSSYTFGAPAQAMNFVPSSALLITTTYSKLSLTDVTAWSMVISVLNSSFAIFVL